MRQLYETRKHPYPRFDEKDFCFGNPIVDVGELINSKADYFIVGNREHFTNSVLCREEIFNMSVNDLAQHLFRSFFVFEAVKKVSTWIPVNPTYEEYQCPRCRKIETIFADKQTGKLWQFCPHCGKNVGEE